MKSLAVERMDGGDAAVDEAGLRQFRRSLPMALLKAREAVMKKFVPHLRAHDMSPQQWRVLRVLEENGPCEPTRIAEDASLLLPSLTRILQKLEAKGLIERRGDPSDRRRQIVRIAPPGVQLIADNLGTAMMLNDEVEQRLGARKYERLLDLLNELSGLELADNHEGQPKS